MKVVQLTLGEMLKKRGFTQRDFSEVSGIRYGTLGKMCTNKITSPPLEHLAICCELLNCELTDIMQVVDVPGEREYKPRIVPRYAGKGRRIDTEA
ncbi:helix-turn-helix domain-containing protein [Paenibacillus hexagrammi]|uniref:Helix-turn-helix transcriptional regulator n=1 Tax=Paenibacillus hexagrammi TaxID=2908839 RepID=A0ABY3STW1_9BACL|nr:helix-turn-helix transcriptional regulator [Paenibacillus sp. YPD9-1]UJF36576.1 helix-turn-helix transcriptional regulator [Paenibacillus sp. YPD9-1]